jgi:hypothetical protein
MLHSIFTKQYFLLLLILLCQEVSSQEDSRAWLNLKGDVKSLRQMKYQVTEDSLIRESGDYGRFENTVFIYIAQQMLLDNSFVFFSEEGRILRWADLNQDNDTTIHFEAIYDDGCNLPKELNFLDRKKRLLMRAGYEVDSMHNFSAVHFEGTSSQLIRNPEHRIISQTIQAEHDETSLSYEYFDDGTVIMQLSDKDGIIFTLTNEFNQQGDFVFDGRYKYKYEYDHKDNWISKTGYYNEAPVIKFTREITYY